MRIDGVCHCSDMVFEFGLDPVKVGIYRYNYCQNILVIAPR